MIIINFCWCPLLLTWPLGKKIKRTQTKFTLITNWHRVHWLLMFLLLFGLKIPAYDTFAQYLQAVNGNQNFVLFIFFFLLSTNFHFVSPPKIFSISYFCFIRQLPSFVASIWAMFFRLFFIFLILVLPIYYQNSFYLKTRLFSCVYCTLISRTKNTYGKHGELTNKRGVGE